MYFAHRDDLRIVVFRRQRLRWRRAFLIAESGSMGDYLDSLARLRCLFPAVSLGPDQGFFKAANNLTISARDPISRQPELKACAVRVRKVTAFPLEDN